MKITLTALLALFLFSCSNPKKDDDKPKAPPETIHSMYNNRLSIQLPKKYQKISLKEAEQLNKIEKSDLVKAVYGYQQIDLYKSAGNKYYFFVDTTNYGEVIHIERLEKRMDINSEQVSAIGSMFMDNFRSNIDENDSKVDIDEAKFASQKFFKFGYFKMHTTNVTPAFFTNQFVVTSRGSTYVITSLSTTDINQYNLQHKLSFNE